MSWLKRLGLLCILASALATYLLWSLLTGGARHGDRPAAALAATSPSIANSPEGPIRWLAAGGGELPDSNQVSLEADLRLAASVFGPGGRLLFAGGPGSDGVQVLDPTLMPDEVVQRLGRIFYPRPGRDSRYRPTTLRADGPATRSAILGAIEEAVSTSSDQDLLLYFGAHGERGEARRDSGIVLWGGGFLTVSELAEALEREPHHRSVRLVVTACFGGGFAEILFAGADAERGRAEPLRCGLFASSWDEPSSGCDPNPDRRAHQGYGVHFLNALRGADKDGTALADSSIDLDGDGRISPLEAHTRVRIESTSFDIPTSTSERWLRETAPAQWSGALFHSPEEDAVVAALGERTQIGADLLVAKERLSKLRERFVRQEAILVLAEQREDDAFHAAATDMLTRWPTLNDPWHPLYATVLGDNYEAIAMYLGSAEPALKLWQASKEVDKAAMQLERTRLARAPVQRLLRALESRVLAGGLQQQGGSAWETYQQLLACERRSRGTAD